jgi:hypothetical protein
VEADPVRRDGTVVRVAVTVHFDPAPGQALGELDDVPLETPPAVEPTIDERDPHSAHAANPR